MRDHDDQHDAMTPPTLGSAKSPTTTTDNARRKLLGSSATAAAASLLGLFASACGDDDATTGSGAGAGGGGGGGGGGTPASSSTAQGTTSTQQSSSVGSGGEGGGGPTDADIDPLNALLTAEYLAITAYAAGASLLDNASEGDPLYDLRDVLVDIAVSFQSDHRLHAEALEAAITDLGGTPVEEEDVAILFAPPETLVDNPTITNVLRFAASAERGATIAYNQVLAGLEAARHRFLAAAIEGDEAQHFIVLTALIAGLAAPGANLSSDTATDVVPQAFAFTVGSQGGLEVSPPDYFP